MSITRYQELFSNLPVAIWEEDFSEVKEQINQLRAGGVDDFSAYFKAHPEVVADCASKVKIIDVNQKTLDIYKASSKKDLLTRLNQVFTAESFAVFAEELAALANGQEHFLSRAANRTLAGDTIYVEVRAVLPEAYRETWQRVLVVTIDITQKYLAEQALRESEERFRQFYRNAPLAYQSLDAEARLIDVNPAFEEMFGYTRDEIIGKGFWELMTEESAQLQKARFPEFIKRGSIEGAEFTVLKKDGTPIEVTVNGRVGVDLDGQFLQTHCLLHNITAQKKSQQEMQRREKSYRRLYEQFRILFDGIPDSLLLLNPDLRISWANTAASQTCAVPVENMIGRTCNELFQLHSAPCDEEMTRQCLKSGETGASLVGTPDGRSWGIRVFPIKDEDGQVIQIMELAHDITDKIKMQAETMRTGQLAALGELAAGVAHEINNPINGIINYAQIIANRARKNDDCDDIAERIVKEGDRIATIVGNLLSFSRDKVEEKRPVDLRSLLDEALSLCSARLRKDSIHLQVDIPDNLPCLLGKHQKLEQVFINLISNAQYALNQKYPGQDSEKKLTISARGLTDAKMIEIIVHDLGVGISEVVRNRILNPFFSTKPQGSGTGLGLSISHGIIQDHDGTLEFDSKEGEFTRVILTLPAASP